MRSTFLYAVVILLLAGCATLPAVEEDVAEAAAARGSRESIELIRVQEERIARKPFIGGNAVTLLRNGPATYAAMIAAIKGARERIDLESYIFDAEEGAKFADLLLEKRAQGLSVNLIYDAWGSSETPTELFDRLKRAGVQVLEFNPIDPTGVIDLNKRDHRKLLIVDAAVAILGGVNISRVYENRHGSSSGGDDPDLLPWRDTDVRIEGPAVADFEDMFLATWRRLEGPPLPPLPRRTGTPPGDAWVHAIDGDPDSDHPLIYRTLMTAITLAQSSIHLTTGYFAPPPDLARALRQAARRGVDMRIVVPALTDSSMTQAAGRGKYAGLMKAGAHIYEREGVVLHAKTAVIDGAWSAVGSSNLDWRSIVFNDESDAVILGARFGGEMEALFAEDMAGSREIDPRQWSERPFGQRLREWGAGLWEFML